jgi:hypothetical protein
MKRQSSLLPYKNEIVALRRQSPPMPYAQIAELLHKKYQIEINREAVFKFVKACATAREKNKNKSYKPCTYAHKIRLDDQRSPAVPELASVAESVVPHILESSVATSYEIIQPTTTVNRHDLELPVSLKPFSHLFESNVSKTTASNEIVNLFSNGQISEKETAQALMVLLSPDKLREFCKNVIDIEIAKGGYSAYKYELLKREITQIISTEVKPDTKEVKRAVNERPMDTKMETLRAERKVREARFAEKSLLWQKEGEEKEARWAKEEAEKK